MIQNISSRRGEGSASVVGIVAIIVIVIIAAYFLFFRGGTAAPQGGGSNDTVNVNLPDTGNGGSGPQQ